MHTSLGLNIPPGSCGILGLRAKFTRPIEKKKKIGSKNKSLPMIFILSVSTDPGSSGLTKQWAAVRTVFSSIIDPEQWIFDPPSCSITIATLQAC